MTYENMYYMHIDSMYLVPTNLYEHVLHVYIESMYQVFTYLVPTYLGQMDQRPIQN